MEKTKPTKPTNGGDQRQPLSPAAYWVLTGVALGLAYLLGSSAINTGSLIEYTATLVMVGLAIKNVIQATTRRRKV